MWHREGYHRSLCSKRNWCEGCVTLTCCGYGKDSCGRVQSHHQSSTLWNPIDDAWLQVKSTHTNDANRKLLSTFNGNRIWNRHVKSQGYPNPSALHFNKVLFVHLHQQSGQHSFKMWISRPCPQSTKSEPGPGNLHCDKFPGCIIYLVS